MQQKSIYNESYRPLFINEMDEEKIKEFSKTLSQKLRHVKLAISKANLGQNKYSHMNEILKNEKEENEKKGSLEEANKTNTKNKKKLKPLIEKKNNIAFNLKNLKDMTPNDIFENCKYEFDKQINDLKKPFGILVRKTKIAPIKSKIIRSNSIDYFEENEAMINNMLK
jgi:hypothetical protein